MPAPVLQFKRGNAGVAGTVPALRPGEPAISLNNFDFFIGIDTSVANNKFFGSHRYWGREDGTNALKLKLVDRDGTNSVNLKAPDTLAGIVTYTLPGTINNGYFLKTNATGELSWAEVVSNINIAADTGIPDNVSTGATITFTGGTNVNTAVTNDTITINLDDNINVSGVATVGSFVSNNGGSFNGDVQINSNLNVNGNVTVGGTTITLKGEDVFIENKDIIVGYTTSILPNDDTANHGGIAIASTIGTPLTSFSATGINTLPDTYKQLMWFKSGTLGFSTDTFAFNYGVAIGTTTMANGVRLAVGPSVTVTDTTVTAPTFSGALSGNASSADQVKTVTAGDAAGNYYVTFVNSHNGSATNETVYTDDGIYYNPGTNTLTSQNGYFTGNLTVDGTITATIAGTASTATRSQTVDTTGTSANADYFVTFVDTLAGQNGETVRVGSGLSVNPSTGDVKAAGSLSVGSPSAVNAYLKAGGGSNALYLFSNGDVSFQAKAVVNEIRSSSNASTLITLNDLDATFANNVKITGITTTSQLTVGTGVGVTQFSASVSTGSSTSSVPTSKAVIDYVGTQVGNIDLTTSIAGDSGTGSVSTSQTFTIAGTANEIETSASNQTITVGLPNVVVVGTSLTAPTLQTGTIKSSTGDIAITFMSNDVTIEDDLTVQGNLYVQGNTTQVNTSALTVEDRTIELGRVGGLTPSSSTTWDLGVLFNYNASGAKKSAVVWEHSATRFQFASVLGSDTDGTDNNSPQLSVTTFAPIEIGSLWVTDCAGTSQVISCTGSIRNLENITIDAGQF